MTALTFTTTGADPIIHRFRGIAERAVDARPAWDVLEARFIRAEVRQFSSEGAGEWPALSADYATWKAEHFPGQPMLRATGELFRSLTSELAISIKEPSFAVFGTDDPVGRIHQQGTSKMPARPPINLSETERRLWAQTVRDWIVEGSADDTGVAA